MSSIEAGLRGGGIAVLLLLALFAWRDARRMPGARYGMLFTLGAAAYLVESAPALVTSDAPWLLPLRLLSATTPATFQLWAWAIFDDTFRPSWRRWLPTVALTLLTLWAIAVDRALPWHIVQGTGLLLVAIGVWQVLGGRAGDLVEGRRRMRLALAIGAGLTIAGFTLLAAFGSRSGALASIAGAAIVLALAAVSAALRLGLRPQTELPPEPATEAVPLDPLAGAAVALDPDERDWLGRLRRLMDEERIYRAEGLGIAALAGRLGLPEYRLRRLINQRLGHRNFSSFVNGYRLAETIAALSDPAQAQVPILTIALDAGFQSLGPFNRAFKAQTGMTPSDFRRDRLERAAARAA
jgi:AraC-like DNA-binding protein